ncbi:MAG: protein phosphatase 2C domain-containing protein [Bacteroidota bacterium]
MDVGIFLAFSDVLFLMNLYTSLKIGTAHTNHCEDYLLNAPIGDHRLLLAVMDGCSMGTESYFISTLKGKLLRKIAKEVYYKAFLHRAEISLQAELTNILEKLFCEVRKVQNDLQLTSDELLSTLLLAIVDTRSQQAEVIVVGDGLLVVDGNATAFDQDDRPDYMAYHLNEDFSAWFQGQSQYLQLATFESLSIATDGIFTFQAFENVDYPPIGSAELMAMLLIDQPDHPHFLHRQLIAIEQKWGLKPFDDLAIIRLMV